MVLLVACYPRTPYLFKAIALEMSSEPPSYSVSLNILYPSSRPSIVQPVNSPSTFTHPSLGISPPSTRAPTSICPLPVLCAQRYSPRNEAALVISPSVTQKKAVKLLNTRAATCATSVASKRSLAQHSHGAHVTVNQTQPAANLQIGRTPLQSREGQAAAVLLPGQSQEVYLLCPF